MPVAEALTVKLPVAPWAVAVTLAWPLEPIGAGLGLKLAKAPEEGAVKVIRPPATGSTALLALTDTTSGLAKAAPPAALWLLPLLTAMVKPWLSKAPMSVAPTRL